MITGSIPLSLCTDVMNLLFDVTIQSCILFSGKQTLHIMNVYLSFIGQQTLHTVNSIRLGHYIGGTTF